MDFVRDVLHSIARDLSHGYFVEAANGLFFVCLMLAVIALIAYGIFSLLDTAFVSNHTCQGTVVDKYFVDGWTDLVNAVPIDHPAHWCVRVEGSRVSGQIDLDPKVSERYPRGQAITIWYRVGRISRNSYVQAIGL